MCRAALKFEFTSFNSIRSPQPKSFKNKPVAHDAGVLCCGNCDMNDRHKTLLGFFLAIVRARNSRLRSLPRHVQVELLLQLGDLFLIIVRRHAAKHRLLRQSHKHGHAVFPRCEDATLGEVPGDVKADAQTEPVCCGYRWEACYNTSASQVSSSAVSPSTLYDCAALPAEREVQRAAHNACTPAFREILCGPSGKYRATAILKRAIVDEARIPALRRLCEASKGSKTLINR